MQLKMVIKRSSKSGSEIMTTKTECFMMPLIHDLTQNALPEEIQALFLYPLNALMEDQKERLEELISTAESTTGTRLTYTVYNGDLPEIEPKNTDRSDDAEKLRRRIEQVTGGKYEWVKEDSDDKMSHNCFIWRFSTGSACGRSALDATPDPADR